MGRLAVLAATGTAAMALMSGTVWASPLAFTLDPSAAGLIGSGSITPFATAGGDANGKVGLTVPGNLTDPQNYSFQAAIQINDFQNSTLTGLLVNNPPGTGLNFDGSKGWEFFVTLNATGSGVWSGTPGDGQTFTASSFTMNVDLWGATDGNSTNFTVPSGSTAPVTGSSSDFGAFGITSSGSPSYVLLAHGGANLSQTSSLVLFDPQDFDTMTFSLATLLAIDTPAFFSNASGPVPLYLRSGCVEGGTIPVPVTDGPPSTFPFFSSSSNGNGCTPTNANEDHVTWDFGVQGGGPNPQIEVPEPGSLMAFGSALLGLGLLARRRRKSG